MTVRKTKTGTGELFRDLINKSDDAIFIADPPTGLFIFVNDKACASLGYERQELLKMGVTDIEAELPDDFSWQAHVNELRQKGSLIFEGMHKRKSGATFPIEANISYVKLKRREYLVTVVRDVTERRRMESAIHLQSEITGNISEGIYLVSANDLRIVYANPKMEEMFGYDHGEMNSRHVSILNATTAGDPAETARQIEKTLREEGAWRGEVYNVRKDGTPFWGHASISILHHPEYGEVYLSLQTDITERKKMEEALQESEKRYKAIVESQAEFVARYLPGGILTFVNDTLCRYTGLRREDLLGKSYYPFIHPRERKHFVRKIEALDRKNPVMVAENRVVLPDGRVTWHRWTHRAIFEESGHLIEYQSSGRDITELKDAEERLKQSEEKYRLLVETANSIILTWDINGDIIFVNDYAERFFRFSKNELIGRNVVGTIVPERESSGRNLADLMQEIQQDPDRFKDNENENITKDGARVWIRWANKAITDEQGRPTGILSVGIDITERKRAEAALRTREKQLAESQRIAHIGSWEHNLKTDRVFWSEELFRLFGLEPMTDRADIVTFFEMVHPEDRPVLKRAIEETMRDNKPFSVDYRLVRRRGETRILHAQAELLCDDVGDLVVLSGTAQDITERKMQEQALAESEANYRNLFDSSTDGIFILDLDGNFIDANRTAYERLGYTRDEILALNITQMDHPSFALQVPERIRQIREHGVVVFESAHLRKDGSKMPVEVNSKLLAYKGKQVFFSVVRDITERKRAEEKLRLSEERFRTLAEAAFEAIVISEGGIFLDANRQLCDMVGYGLDELRGKPVIEIIAPEDREQVRHNQSIGYEAPYENRLMHKDGSIIRAESRARHYTIHDRKVRVTVIRDITQRKQAEEDVLKTQKLESLGILAGGIAHDFNNILTAILGNISLARMNMKPGEPQYARLEEAERASDHARRLTHQLLTFAKGGAPVKKTLSVEQLIRDSAGFAVRGSNVRCDFSFGRNLLPVDVDEGQMGQVFNNLVINACQAMPRGGIVRIDAGNVDVGAGDGLPLPKGKFIKITIEDKGTGISEENLQRIFDPYFTTKRNGSGLGLSIVYSVLKNHNAYITVKSGPGVGTTFVIYLPASTEGVPGKELKTECHGAGKGRILLMDDEEIVRKVAGDILQEMGYEVEFATDGAEAISLYKTAMSSSHPFDAVIMDLTVPGGMGGKEAIEGLLEADPEARAIVSSGYSQDPVMANYREYGFCEVVAKPFSGIELGRVMHKVIGRQ